GGTSSWKQWVYGLLSGGDDSDSMEEALRWYEELVEAVESAPAEGYYALLQEGACACLATTIPIQWRRRCGGTRSSWRPWSPRPRRSTTPCSRRRRAILPRAAPRRRRIGWRWRTPPSPSTRRTRARSSRACAP